MKHIPYILGLILALTLLVGMRLPFLRCEPFVPGAPLLFDEKDYLHGARSFAAGDTTNDTAEAWMRAPATAWMLLTLARLRGLPPELAGCDFQIMQIAMWAAILLLVAALANMLFDRRVALASALVLALLPVGMSVTLMVHADTLFCLMLLATVWALLRYARSTRPRWLLVAGVCAGIGILTRSLLLPLLPLLALWIMYETWRARAPEQSLRQLRAVWRAISAGGVRGLLRLLLPCVLFLGIVALELAPWTIRNYQLYGGFIPSDTTGAINLFRNNGNGPDVDFETIRDYSPNPAERQRYASRRAWEFISSDPASFAQKFVYSGLIGWSPDSFLHTRDFYTAVTEQPRTGSLLSQLTVLLWLAIPLLLLGLLFAPHAAPGATGYRALMLGTALLYTVMMGATHFEDRYRLPFVLLWLPYAGWCLAHPRALLARLWRPAGLIAVGAIVVISLLHIPLLWPSQWDDARALVLHGRGLLRERAGDLAGALADQQAAAALEPDLREARVAAGQLQMREGDLAGAEQTLRSALRDAQTLGVRTPADATVALQQVLRAQGRIAESAARDAVLEPAMRRRAEAMAWQRGATPSADLQLAVDDLGLVSGFYSASEQQAFRWSGPQARVLLAGQGQYACLRASANRPLDIAAPVVALSARLNGGASTALASLHPPRQGWAWLCAPLPQASGGTTLVELDLQTTSYNPFAAGRGKDARDLGVAVSEVVLRDGPLALDPATGLLLDQLAVSAEPAQSLQLIGMSGDARSKPGANVPITLWWRDQQAPPSGVFTFLHVLDANGQKVADYNAPLAGDQRPQPWVAAEPLLDQAALALPANLAPGRYRLIGGAFDPASGARLAQADLGELVVE